MAIRIRIPKNLQNLLIFLSECHSPGLKRNVGIYHEGGFDNVEVTVKLETPVEEEVTCEENFDKGKSLLAAKLLGI